MNLEHIRRRLHARYARAVIAGTALTVALCSIGIAAVEVRHGVSFQAVTRFFSRNHLRQTDLTKLVHDPATVRQLKALSLPELGVNPGGLVYANGGGLDFHLHLTDRAKSTRQQHLENQRIYPQLVRHYVASDLDSLLKVLNSPGAAARLEGEGVERIDTLDLSHRSVAAMDYSKRRKALRRAARYFDNFAPFDKEPFALSFGEKLRFYEFQRPRGQFVGAFEIHGFGPSSVVDLAYANAISRHDHYLLIYRTGLDRFKVRDFYRGQMRRYTIGIDLDLARI